RKSKLLPKYSTFQKAYNDFGLQAPIINNLLDARLVTVWKRLMTGNTLWALFQRDTITRLLRTKRNIEVVTAIKENPIKLKSWPDEWKPYLKAWRKATGTVLASSSWPWEDSMIQIGLWTGAQITVKRVVSLLRDALTTNNTENRKHTIKSTQWRFDEQCLKNNQLLKEIKDEISDKEADTEWDLCKIKVQSIIRAFRGPRSPENRILQLNKRICTLKGQKAKAGSLQKTVLYKAEGIDKKAAEEIATALPRVTET
ncbi:17038_t:CDS:2, partial [Gigaspora rosea]